MKNKITATFFFVLSFGLPLGFSCASASEFYKNTESASVDPYDYTRMATQELSGPIKNAQVKNAEAPVDRALLQSQMQKELTQIQNYRKPSAYVVLPVLEHADPGVGGD